MLDVRFLNQLTATDENSKANHVPVIHFQKCEHWIDFSFYAIIPLQMAIFTAISTCNKLAILLIIEVASRFCTLVPPNSNEILKDRKSGRSV